MSRRLLGCVWMAVIALRPGTDASTARRIARNEMNGMIVSQFLDRRWYAVRVKAETSEELDEIIKRVKLLPEVDQAKYVSMGDDR